MRPADIDGQTAEWLGLVERVRRDPSVGFDEQWRRFLELG
jgi:hypothetical protein